MQFINVICVCVCQSVRKIWFNSPTCSYKVLSKCGNKKQEMAKKKELQYFI